MKWKCDYHGIYKGSLTKKILKCGNFAQGEKLMILLKCEMQCNYPQI